jgi:hypothetical protein
MPDTLVWPCHRCRRLVASGVFLNSRHRFYCDVTCATLDLQDAITPAEREAILRTDDASDAWSIWSAKGSRQARRLLKRCTPVAEDAMGYRFMIPVAWVRIVPSRPRTLTGEERRAIGARLAAAKRRS